MTEIYIAHYEDGMYPEDNFIIGAYTTEEKAEEAINRAVEYAKQNNDTPHKQSETRYHVTYTYLYSED